MYRPISLNIIVVIEPIPPGNGEILREFISKSLYSKTTGIVFIMSSNSCAYPTFGIIGYFNSVDCININSAIDFPSLVDSFHYRTTVANMYKV
jgi:hypothetical protein